MWGDLRHLRSKRHVTSAPADSTRIKKVNGHARTVRVEVFLLVTLLNVDVRVVMGLTVERVTSVVKVNFQMPYIFVKIALLGIMLI